MSILDIQIRPFERSDQEIVRQLILEGLAEHFERLELSLNPDLSDIEGHYLRKGHLIVVALLNDQIVGSGALVRESLTTGRIARLSVSSKFRRTGIGSLIVKFLISEAHQSDLTRVVVETNTDWIPAIRLYEKLGFEEYKCDTESVHFKLSLGSSRAAEKND